MTEIKRYDVNKANMIGLVRFDEKESGQWVKYEDLAAIQEQLSRYSMSAGQADQRKSESDAVRVALGFSADADDVSPSDLIREIVSLKNKALYLRSDRDEWERRAISNFNNCAEMDKQVRTLAAENSIQDFIISAVKDLVRESEGVAGWHLNGDIASWDEALPELNHSETPATDAALREVRAQARAEGIHFAANRLLAAWESGFVDDTPAAAHDISGAILSAVEFLPNADEAEFRRDYADEVRARIRAGEKS